MFPEKKRKRESKKKKTNSTPLLQEHSTMLRDEFKKTKFLYSNVFMIFSLRKTRKDKISTINKQQQKVNFKRTVK